MKINIFKAPLLLMALLTTLISNAQNNRLIVNADQSGVVINRHIYGHSLKIAVPAKSILMVRVK